MHTEYLIKMANQIGTFFESQPNREQAMTDLAKHLQNNWEHRMRSNLLEYVDQQAGEGLLPIVVEAVAKHRQEWPV
ncbi:MAG TPA: formate dehydrogenase subunit delta [Rhodocyclaceae bacterium]|jgi:formate dehydrogenase subunit delta